MLISKIIKKYSQKYNPKYNNVLTLLLQIIISAFLLININSSYAMLEIEITQGVDAALPFAVAPFEVKTNLNKDQIDQKSEVNQQELSVLTNVIHDDLYRSGLFKPFLFEFSSNDSNQSSEHNSLVNIPVEQLQTKGAEYLIKGKIEINPYNKLNISFQLIDLYQLTNSINNSINNNNTANPVSLDNPDNSNLIDLNKSILLSKSFDISSKYLRYLGHHISDLVYEQLTGTKGVFSTKIAYVNAYIKENNKNEYVLEVADSDGYNPQALVTSSEPIMSPTWKPDGKEIAYVSFEGFRSSIKIVELATGNTRKVTSFKGINGAPSWSPDGSKMALVLSQENTPKIYLLNLNNNKLTKLTSGVSIDTEPSWYPNGKALIFTSNRGGSPQIYKYSLDTKKITRVTFDGEYNARGQISADGRKLVLIHRSDDKKFKIAVQDLDNYNLEVLTDSNLDESPSISANGQQVIYATKKFNKRILAEVSLDGRVKLNRPSVRGDVQEPAWSPFLS